MQLDSSDWASSTWLRERAEYSLQFATDDVLTSFGCVDDVRTRFSEGLGPHRVRTYMAALLEASRVPAIEERIRAQIPAFDQARLADIVSECANVPSTPRKPRACSTSR